MPALLTGLKNTLLITLLSFAIALVLGVAFGLMKVSENKILEGIAKVYIAVFVVRRFWYGRSSSILVCRS